jgi:hypothetical protein
MSQESIKKVQKHSRIVNGKRHVWYMSPVRFDVTPEPDEIREL